MASWWDKAALALQQNIRSTERSDDTCYGKREVALATVHMREDIVVLVSHISSLNRQLAGVAATARFIALLLIIDLVLRYWWHW